MGRVKERNGVIIGPDRLQGKRKEKEKTRKIKCLDRLEEALMGVLEKRVESGPEVTKKDILDFELLLCQCRESRSGGLFEKLFASMASEGTIDVSLFKSVKQKREYREAVGRPNEIGLVEEIIEVARLEGQAADALELTMMDARERISSGKKNTCADSESIPLFDERRDAINSAAEELLRKSGFHQLIRNKISGEDSPDELLDEVADVIIPFKNNIMIEDVLEVGLVIIIKNLEARGISIHSLDGGKIDVVYTLADAKDIEKAFRDVSAENKLFEFMSKMELD